MNFMPMADQSKNMQKFIVLSKDCYTMPIGGISTWADRYIPVNIGIPCVSIMVHTSFQKKTAK